MRFRTTPLEIPLEEDFRLKRLRVLLENCVPLWKAFLQQQKPNTASG